MFDRQPIGDDFTWMHSGQLGATVLNALGSTPNGQMLKMLDACLVDGFNIQTVASVAVSGSVVVLTFGLPHGYTLKQKITVSGSDDALLNGSHRIISQTADTVTLKISGVTNTSGVIKTKVSPLGFESVIGDTKPLIRGYRSKDPTSTKTVLHLDMSYPDGAGYHSISPARRAMVTACTGVDEAGAPIGDYFASVHNKPTNPNGSLFWHETRGSEKSRSVNYPELLSWVIVGNGKYFYFFHSWYPADYQLRDFYAFGDMNKLGVNDQHCCILKAGESANDSSDPRYYSFNGSLVSTYEYADRKTGYFIGNSSGSVIPIGTSVGYAGMITSPAGSGYTNQSGYQSINPITGSLMLAPAYAYTVVGIRARMPRLMILPFNISGKVLDLSIIDDVLFIATSGMPGLSASQKYQGCFAFDVGV